MSCELTLLLVRHGETHYNAEGRFQGSQDIPLSDRGREQAYALQRRLASSWAAPSHLIPGPPHHVFSSNLSRAVETAKILSAPLPVSEMPLLRERAYGNWEGLTTSEIRERFGAHSQPENAEPFEEVRERIKTAFTDIWAQTLSEQAKATALVVGHGGSLRYFFSIALGIGSEPARRMQMDNTGLSIVVFRGPSAEKAEGRLILLNDVSHLGILGHAERPRATPPR